MRGVASLAPGTASLYGVRRACESLQAAGRRVQPAIPEQMPATARMSAKRAPSPRGLHALVRMSALILRLPMAADAL